MIQKQIDKNYCEHVRTVLNEIGIDLSADVQIFYKPVEHEKRIPLDLAAVRKSECRKASIVGAVLALPDNYGGRKLQRTLQKQGYTAYLYGPRSAFPRIWIADYLPPATRDSDGFFIENDALAVRIRRELQQGPYNRKGHNIHPLLLTNEQRGNCEDVIGFIPGERSRDGYQPEYRYMTSKLFMYSNLEASIKTVIPRFDIYGFEYPVSSQQWEQIKKNAGQHGNYAAITVQEIDDWIYKPATDPILTIMCI